MPDEKEENMETIKTLDDALKAGYVRADMRLHVGYAPRYADIGKTPVHIAGGKRKNEFYIMLPCDLSLKYYYRQYLRRKIS